MPHDPFDQFVVLFFLGLGLLLAAIVNLSMRAADSSHRAVATLLAIGASTLACWGFEGRVELLEPLSVALLFVAVPVFLLSTPRGISTFVTFAERARRPLAAWWCCGLIGVAILVAAGARYEHREEARVDSGMKELDTLESLDDELGPTTYCEAEAGLTTDLGHPIEAWRPIRPRPDNEMLRIEEAGFRVRGFRDAVIRQSRGDDRTNCYGWILTGGKTWIPDLNLKRILDDNGYREVREPQAGDLVAYQREGKVIHMAIVRYLGSDRPPMVEGKWGFNGVYLHVVDQSIYGKEFAYLRSPREGHLLKGVPRRESPPLEDDRTE